MPWTHLADRIRNLKKHLGEFAWDDVAADCDSLVATIESAATPMDGASASAILAALRKKLRFAEIERLAESLAAAGQNEAQVRRQYAQALIEQRKLVAAAGVLAGLVVAEKPGSEEHLQGLGLQGRLHKQCYVGASDNRRPAVKHELRLAIEHYLSGYRASRETSLWHAINVVACVTRARRDKLKLPGLKVDDKKLARSILQRAEQETNPDPWNVPIRIEALLALERHDEALDVAETYLADPSIDAFEYRSFLRQLVEVWQLSPETPPGSLLIAGVKASLVRRAGGEIELSPREIRSTLQCNFDSQKYVSVSWLKHALTRCSGIARVETLAGEKIGTGFLVEPAEFFGTRSKFKGNLLLTNWHVISEKGRFPGSLAPTAAVVRFGMAKKTSRCLKVIAFDEDLDACFVSLERVPAGARPCPLAPDPEPFKRDSTQRVYVIGHPRGGDLSISLHDSSWLDQDGHRLHYRTPTDIGSSGSPVFDDRFWSVRALHQRGSTRMARLRNEPGFYEANEGIAIASIRAAMMKLK
jgi:tetratricopeptide (TPR) repeat protein